MGWCRHRRRDCRVRRRCRRRSRAPAVVRGLVGCRSAPHGAGQTKSRGALRGPPAGSAEALSAPVGTYEGHTSPASAARRGARVRSMAATLVKQMFLFMLLRLLPGRSAWRCGLKRHRAGSQSTCLVNGLSTRLWSGCQHVRRRRHAELRYAALATGSTARASDAPVVIPNDGWRPIQMSVGARVAGLCRQMASTGQQFGGGGRFGGLSDR